MQKTVKKTVTPAVRIPKAGTITGQRDIVTQTNPYWHTIMEQLRTVAQLYCFQSVETSILEEEKTYQDYYKNQPDALE